MATVPSSPPDALACTLTVVAFNQDGTPTNSARLADFILCHWSLSNLTSGVRTLTFKQGQLFKMRILDDKGATIWALPDPAPGQDLPVRVDPGGTYSIPPDTAGVNDAGVPRIDLKTVLAAAGVAQDVELTVEFTPLAVELAQRLSLRLW